MPQLRLVAPWKEAQALLENERHSEAAMEAFENMCRTVPCQAAEMVFWAVSVEDGIGYRAVERELLVIRDLEETAPRLGLQAEDLLAETHAHVDRFGDYKAPNGAPLEGRRLCPELSKASGQTGLAEPWREERRDPIKAWRCYFMACKRVDLPSLVTAQRSGRSEKKKPPVFSTRGPLRCLLSAPLALVRNALWSRIPELLRTDAQSLR